MNKKQELNELVKESIVTAFLQMLQTMNIDEISIVDLTKKAGVARNSFYRNFRDKKDIVRQKLISLIEEWGRNFEKDNDPSLFGKSLLQHYYEHRDFYLFLYKRNLSDMIYETIRYATKLNEAKNSIERYAKSMLAGMIFGWIDEWMRQGMPETPEEIALLSEQLTSNNKQNGKV